MINKKEKNEIKEGFFDEKDFISPSYINLNNPRFLEIDDYFYSGKRLYGDGNRTDQIQE